MPPTISVVIPVYNAQLTIGPTIQSVFAQTYRDFEVIVVDDGSTDGTSSEIKNWGDRVRYVWQKQSRPAVARNRGATEAKGEFVAFLDADDLWLPQKLEKQLRTFQNQPDLTAVQTGALLVNDAMQVLEVRRAHPLHDSFLDFLLFHNLPAFSSSVMIRRDHFLEIGGFATDLIMETWDMACRLIRSGKIKSLEECLVLYRQHAGNRSRQVKLHIDTGFRSLQRIFSDPTLDPHIRSQKSRIWARFYAMLAGGYFHNRQWGSCLQWTQRAILTSPSVIPYILGMPLRRFTQGLTRLQKRSVAKEVLFVSFAQAGGNGSVVQN